ncbi:centrosomal protein of 55 kDa isoform X2 [Gadus morhua]|uniref:centrosomal protein of 55 kDa isoform X2 n=1 Tax=Gadus morhua TaxID=8049 RepID=UPI0011B48D65|nr:centrosomal protein of 55 kDa-like isoform X2 [Gadus morhua]
MLFTSHLCGCVQESDPEEMETEVTRQDAASVDMEYNHLLRRILSLETIKEKNYQQLSSKDEEIDTLRYKLSMTQEEEEVYASLQDQMDNCIQEREPNDKLLQSLQTEMVEIKNKLVTMSTRCQDLEKTVKGHQDYDSDGQSTCSATVAHIQLRDALEKNQQWLAYDQQREHYLRGVLDELSGLKQQLNQANQALSEQHNAARSDERERMSQMQDHYDRLLLKAKTELEALREQLNVAHEDLDKMQWSYEKKQLHVQELQEQIQVERLRSQKRAQEEKSQGGERERALRAQAEDLRQQLDEEKHQSAELQLQVNVLQNTVLNHQDDHRKIGILEQQIQMSARDLEEEKRDCLNLQKQLYRLLKELRKTSKTTAAERHHQDASGLQTSGAAPDRCGSPRTPGTLNQSFLECPGCRAQYRSSQHRELLAHLDHCLD